MKEVQDNIKIYYPDNETIDYEYDRPDDEPSGMLKQDYHLEMAYDLSHNIVSKNQIHQFGSVSTLGQSLPTNAPHAPTSYSLEYGDYAKGVYIADNQGYAQPHAPRVITEYPPDYSQNPDGMRVKKKIIDYDANGNQTEIREQVSDPEEPLGYREVAVRKNLWDEDDRLMGVDLAPENPRDKPLIAAYTYSADGERAVRYLPARLDAYYSAKDAGSTDRLKSILYPNSLITVKTLPLPEGLGMDEIERLTITKYTKHYYIGSERVASALGHTKHVGMLCEQSGFPEPELIDRMNEKVLYAGEGLKIIYDAFEKRLVLGKPLFYGREVEFICEDHDPDKYAPFWYHPDHLGSSSYITNLSGEINQHMEYLPFGETLVEEHLNSNNSPYKFNAKEFDAETGNYYYGARYYDPKWSIWLSVDAEFARFPSYSPYNYTLLNPINLVDPDGNAPIRPIPPINPIDIHNGIKAAGKYLNSLMVGGYNFVSSRGTNKNQRKDINNETKTINVDDIIAVSPSSAKGINAKGSLVKKTVEGASDAVESVNKVKEIFGIDKPNNNQADNKSVPSFTFDFWKNEEPHGGGDGAIGIEAAIQRKNELQKQFPDLDITIRPVDQPHPHNQKYETE